MLKKVVSRKVLMRMMEAAKLGWAGLGAGHEQGRGKARAGQTHEQGRGRAEQSKAGQELGRNWAGTGQELGRS